MGLGSMISSFLHPERGYKEAGHQIQKYYKDAQGRLQPIYEQGEQQFPRLMQQAETLNNPVALENQWADTYQASPYAQHLMNQAKESGLDAASSMGLMGSSAALNNIQQSSADIMQSERQQYMNDLMNKYLQSIGIGNNIYGIGANAAGAMSTNAMNTGQNMAGAKMNQANAPGALFGDVLGRGANALINHYLPNMSPYSGGNTAVAGGA